MPEKYIHLGCEMSQETYDDLVKDGKIPATTSKLEAEKKFAEGYSEDFNKRNSLRAETKHSDEVAH